MSSYPPPPLTLLSPSFTFFSILSPILTPALPVVCSAPFKCRRTAISLARESVDPGFARLQTRRPGETQLSIANRRPTMAMLYDDVDIILLQFSLSLSLSLLAAANPPHASAYGHIAPLLFGIAR